MIVRICRSIATYHGLFGALLFALPFTSSCKGADPSRHIYSLELRSQTLDDRPVGGVAVISPDGEETAITDSSGIARFSIEGREGEEVALRITKLPPDYIFAAGSEEQRVLLKDVGKKGAGGIEIRHDLRLRRIRENYVVLVAAERVAELKVAANGTVIGQLNSRGAGAFRLEGKPGEELKVAILTEGNRRYSAQDPDKIFALPENGGLLSYTSNLSLNPEPIIEKKERPKRHVKVQQAAPTQIPFQQTISVHKKH